MPHRNTVSLRRAFAQPWKLSRHVRIHLHLNRLSPFRNTDSHRKPSSSTSSSSSAVLCRKKKKRRGFRSLFFVLQCQTQKADDSSEMDKVGDLREFNRFSEKVYPSPVTPLYVKNMAKRRVGDEAAGAVDLEEACKSFEKYIVEMIVDDGKVGDLTDMEELLVCWENLRCPVYIELVCRFYADMCENLFSADQDDYDY